MTEPWLESVDEHRDVLERWAASDLPLSEEIQLLLKQADEARDSGK